jgi:hypothetical protein
VDIEDNDAHIGIPDVGGDDASKAFLASRVPELQFVGTPVLGDNFGEKINPYSWLMLTYSYLLLLHKLELTKCSHNRSLADGGVTQQYYLQLRDYARAPILGHYKSINFHNLSSFFHQPLPNIEKYWISSLLLFLASQRTQMGGVLIH